MHLGICKQFAIMDCKLPMSQWGLFFNYDPLNLLVVSPCWRQDCDFVYCLQFKRWGLSLFLYHLFQLIEVTFIVLDCFYAYTWLLDRTWITSGLHDIWRGTINVGVLFNFLRTAFLALIPIICVNRIIGGIAIIKKLRIVVYVVRMHVFVFILNYLTYNKIIFKTKSSDSRLFLKDESWESVLLQEIRTKKEVY